MAPTFTLGGRAALTIAPLAALLFAGCLETERHVPPPAGSFAAQHHHDLHRRLTAAVDAASSRYEASLLRGLAWLARFGDDDRRLEAVLSDYLLALAELRHAGPAKSRALAHELLRAELSRIRDRLPELFTRDQDGRWDFITVLWVAAQAGEHPRRYRLYYETHFQGADGLPAAPHLDDALARNAYGPLGDALIDGSFAHDLRRRHSETRGWLPHPRFDELLRRMEAVKLEHTRFSNPPAYHDQLYFLTHVVLAAAAYGTRALPPAPLLQRTQGVLGAELPTVLATSPDTDLLGEMVQCALLDPRPRATHGPPTAIVQRACETLLGRQRADGSWRRPGDASHSPYRAMHGTWAAATAVARCAAYRAPSPELKRRGRAPRGRRP